MSILKKLVICVLIAFSLGEIGRYLFPDIGTVQFLLSDVLITITVISWLLIKLYKKETIQGRLRIPILLFIVICCISLIINNFFLNLPQFIISALYIVRWSMYAGLYFVIKDFDHAFKQKITTLLVIVGQIIICIGFIQFFLYPSLRNLYYLGWDEHLYRMFSVFLDPNFAGVFFVLIFILTLSQTLLYFQKKNFTLSSLVGLFVFLDIIAVYLTYSRSALLMLFISVVIFLWLYGAKKYIFGTLVVLCFALLFSPKSFQTEGTNILRIASTEARVTTAKDAIDIFEKNPIIGVGFNAYRYAQSRYGYISGRYWEVSHAGAGTDNSFLFVLATTGVIGFASFLYLLFSIFQLEKQTLGKKEMRIMAIVTISSLIGVMVSSLFINSLFYSFIMAWLWILISLTSFD